MMKAIKWIVIVGVGIVAIAVIAAYIVVASYDFNRLKPQIAEAVRNATGRELSIGGNIDLKLGMSPSLVLENVKFQNAEWGTRDNLFTAKRLEAKTRLLPLLSGQIEITRFTLLDPDVLIEKSKAGKLNISFETGRQKPPKTTTEQTPPKRVELPSVFLNEFLIRDGVVTYKDLKSGFSHALKVSRFSANAESANAPVNLAFEGSSGGQPFSLTGTVGSLAGLAKDDRPPWPVNLQVSALGGQMTIEGAVGDPVAARGIDLSFAVAVQDPKPLSQLMKSDMEMPSPIAASGHLKNDAPDRYRINDLKVGVGQSDVSGNAAVEMAGVRPELSAELASNKLDLRPFTSTKTDGEQEKTDGQKEKSGPVFPKEPLPLDALKAIDADVALDAKTVVSNGLVLNDLHVEAKLKDGNLAVEPMRASMGGGSLAAALGLKQSGGRAEITSKLGIDHLDLASMLRQMGKPEDVVGLLDFDLTLASRGNTVAALAAAADGKAGMNLDDGRISNKYLRMLDSEIGKGIVQLIHPAYEQQDYTAINCLIAGFNIQKGVAKTTAMVFDTDYVSVAGDGEIDLGKETLDISFQTQPKKSAGQLGANLGKLTGLVKLGGTLSDPAVQMNKTEMAATIGKAASGFAKGGAAGLAQLLADTGSNDQNPCESALQAVKSGKKPVRSSNETKTDTAAPPTQKRVQQEIEKSLKGLFGQ